MKRFAVDRIERLAKDRWQGYLEAVRCCATVVDGFYVFDETAECFHTLILRKQAARVGAVKMFADVPPKPIPRKKWPLIVRAVAMMKGVGDRGIGDTMERLAGRPGKLFKRAAKVFDWDCKCGSRQARYNWLYPYE